MAVAGPQHDAPTSAAPTTDDNDKSYLRAVGKGFVVGTVIWTALVLALMYLIADFPLDEALKWALWIGPWGGIFLGGTFTVGFWSAKHADD
jgi:hypothetical protein